jgi:hypothetical protein
LIVKARFKSAGERDFSVGWYSAVLDREKRIKPLGDYLKPEMTPEQKRLKGERDVGDMFRRLAQKGETDGSR